MAPRESKGKESFANICVQINTAEERKRKRSLIKLMRIFGCPGSAHEQTKNWSASLKTLFEFPNGSTKTNITKINVNMCGNKILNQITKKNDCEGRKLYEIVRTLKVDRCGVATANETVHDEEDEMDDSDLGKIVSGTQRVVTTSTLENPDGSQELTITIAAEDPDEGYTVISNTTIETDPFGVQIGSTRKTIIHNNCGYTMTDKESAMFKKPTGS